MDTDLLERLEAHRLKVERYAIRSLARKRIADDGLVYCRVSTLWDNSGVFDLVFQTTSGGNSMRFERRDKLETIAQKLEDLAGKIRERTQQSASESAVASPLRPGDRVRLPDV